MTTFVGFWINLRIHPTFHDSSLPISKKPLSINHLELFRILSILSKLRPSISQVRILASPMGFESKTANNDDDVEEQLIIDISKLKLVKG